MTTTSTSLDGPSWPRDHLQHSANSTRPIEWQDLDKRKFYLIGPSIFMTVRLALYPPTLVKTRLQVQTRKSMYKGSFDAFKQILKHEGVRGLYKGFLMNSVGLIAGQCYVTTYEMSRHYAKSLPFFESSPTARNLLGGALASTVAQSILVPVDVVSQLQMVQRQTAGPTVGVATAQPSRLTAHMIAKEICMRRGAIGLYRGYAISLLTFVPTNAIWWASYGKLTETFQTRCPNCSVHLLQAAAGSCAGMISATLTNPIDVTRAVLQVRSSIV